jgi:glycosyltransferase involved in cell wall biosynthesis
MSSHARKRVLVLSPEYILPPGHGGSLRSASLIKGLAETFDTTVIVPQGEGDIRKALEEHSDLTTAKWLSAFPNYSTKKRSLLCRLRGRLERYQDDAQKKRWKNMVHDWYFGPLLRWNEVVREQLRSLKPDVVIIEHTRHAATLQLCKKISPNAVTIVNSQNVESALVRQILSSSREPSELNEICNRIEETEKSLGRYADSLWVCSDIDKERYIKLGVKIDQMSLVPNGVDTKMVGFKPFDHSPTPPSLLFIGSLSYAPNVEGVIWFNDQVWPALKSSNPGIKWNIVGRWPSDVIYRIAENDTSIQLHPNVPSTMPYLKEATLAICPLFSGGGTRLKILEAFSAGVPVVATSTGAEGLSVTSGKHLLIADTAVDFIESTDRILRNQPQFEEMRNAARKLVVDEYDWEVISRNAVKLVDYALSIKKSQQGFTDKKYHGCKLSS